jgi:hypothetical protein
LRMVELKIRGQAFDEATSASAATLEIGRVNADLPGKFVQSSEINAMRLTELRELSPGKIIVSTKLMPPDTLKRVLTEEKYLKDLTGRLVREGSTFGDTAQLLYLAFKGESKVEKIKDMRTLLDLQFFCDVDIITIQHTPGVSPKDYVSLFSSASRWSEERGFDKPLMPVLSAPDSKEEFEEYLSPILKREPQCLGIDMRGGFHYHTLRAVEEAKKKRPDMWVHVFQVPPKVLFGRNMASCSQGMILPYFGVDSFNKWIVPPPPVPLTKDKINIFDRTEWSVLKRKDWREVHGKKLECDCPICEAKNLDSFFEGKVMTALARSKVHDHFAQKDELRVSASRIKEKSYKRLLQSKEGPKNVLKAFEKSK